MPQTVEAIYHDGVLELKEKPPGIKKSSALVIFLDPEEPKEDHLIDWDKAKNSKSTVDKLKINGLVFLKERTSATGNRERGMVWTRQKYWKE